MRFSLLEGEVRVMTYAIRIRNVCVLICCDVLSYYCLGCSREVEIELQVKCASVDFVSSSFLPYFRFVINHLENALSR